MIKQLTRFCFIFTLLCFVMSGCQKKVKEPTTTRNLNVLATRLFGDLDRVIHQPIRTKIMAYLVARNQCDFSTIKELFNLNDGHMTTHMRELIGAGYVRVEKTYEDNKPKTIYHMTGMGRSAFEVYVDVLKRIVF